MAEGLAWDHIQDPGYAFTQGTEFVSVFGRSIGADLINPREHPAVFAEAVAKLNPRYPQSVFNEPGTNHSGAGEYVDRYVMADNGLPAWAAGHENVINYAAHVLGIRDRGLGTTFQYKFKPGEHYELGLVLEGANQASENRGRALADAIRNGEITVDKVLVAGTGRKVGEREGHGDLTIGYEVASKVVGILREEYNDLFADGQLPINALDIRTHAANTREVATEAALRADVGSIAMTGSNIYGPWMSMDLATVQHTLGLDRVDFGAGPDDPKAARTPRIWAAEVAQTLVSAAHLQQAYMLKKRG